MSTFLLLIGALFILGINSFASTDKIRLPREPNDPIPIDCLMSDWSEWGPCNPCAKEKYRSRSVLNYGQFGGRACQESLGQRERCEPDIPCLEEEVDCGRDFKCDNGRCIKARLACNTEDDCGDLSDEENCEDYRPSPCRDRIMDVSELGRISGHGVNILGMKPQASPFDNEFYNGMCDRIRDGNSGIYFRKPWNVAVLNYETRGDKRLRAEYYEDQMTSLHEMLRETRFSFGARFSIKMFPTETEEGNRSLALNAVMDFKSTKTNSISEFLNESKGKKQLFLHVKSSIQLGKFIMRSRDHRLSDLFLDDLKYLPTIYDKGQYFKFLETHGTHYARRGTFGGRYELLYVLDSDSMSREGITIGDVQSCLGYNTDFSLSVSNFESKYDISHRKCGTEKFKKVINRSENAIINDVVTLVQGGKTDVLVKLKEQLSTGNRVIDIEDYVQWAATIPDVPAIIGQEIEPISELVPLNMPDSREKKQNIDRAIEDYIDEYNVCKCQPCQNGGTVLLLNGKCECACTPNFKGEACQTPSPTSVSGQVATDGEWSCWSDWSACKDGVRTRTRLCNNPAPSAGGRPCRGADSQTGYCSDAE